MHPAVGDNCGNATKLARTPGAARSCEDGGVARVVPRVVGPLEAVVAPCTL